MFLLMEGGGGQISRINSLEDGLIQDLVIAGISDYGWEGECR